MPPTSCTPLATIRLATEPASRVEPMPAAEAQGILQVVNRQTQRLTTLVSDLLILSRLEQADDRSAPTLIYLPDLVNDIAEEFAALALAKGIHLTTVAPDAKSLTVRGHESELYRLLLNIVGNALEYTPKGGSVTIRLTSRDRYALIEVEDTGIGIAPPTRPKFLIGSTASTPIALGIPAVLGWGWRSRGRLPKPTAAIFRSKVQSAKVAVSLFSSPEQPKPIPQGILFCTT